MQYQAAETGELLLPQVVNWPGDGGRLNSFTLRPGAINCDLWHQTDHRADRLRFGFGLYHDDADVNRLCEVLGRTLS